MLNLLASYLTGYEMKPLQEPVVKGAAGTYWSPFWTLKKIQIYTYPKKSQNSCEYQVRSPSICPQDKEKETYLTENTRETVNLGINAKGSLDSGVHVGNVGVRSGENVLGGKGIVQVVLGAESKSLAEVVVHILVLDVVGGTRGCQGGDTGAVLGPLVRPEGVVVAVVRGPVGVHVVHETGGGAGVVLETGIDVLLLFVQIL